MEEMLREQLVQAFIARGASDVNEAIEATKMAFHEGDIFMLPKDNEIKDIFQEWAKSIGLEESQRLAEEMFNSYNEAIDDVLSLMQRLKTTNKDTLMKKIEKLKR